MKINEPTFVMPNFGKSPKQFIAETKEELKKVVWPSKKEVVKLTTVVLVVSLLVSAYIGGWDWLFTKIMEVVLRR